MAAMRSSGVRNHASVGESGKKNLTEIKICQNERDGCAHQNRTEVKRVMMPVMIINLGNHQRCGGQWGK